MKQGAIWLTLSTLWGCLTPQDTTSSENNAPFAALRAPVIAPVGVPVTLDASDSYDPDSDPLDYRFEVAGFASSGAQVSPVTSGEPVITLVFPADGLYTVQVWAIDLHGARGMAMQDVTARSEYPDPPDFCVEDSDCVVGDLCEGGVCFAVGGSVD